MRTAKEDFSVACHTKGVFIDSCQWETILHAVVLKLFHFLIEDGEALIGNQYQFTADGRFLCIVNAITDKSVLALVEVFEIVGSGTVQVEATSRSREPQVTLTVLHDVVHIIVAEAVCLRSVVTVVGQLVRIEAVGEDTFACGGNPECTAIIYLYICNHSYFTPFFAIFKELLTFSGLRIEQAYTVLGSDNQLVLVGGNVTNDIGRKSFRISFFHKIMRECTCADIQFVQSAKVGSYPDDFLCGIIIKGFHVTVGDAVASLSGKIPLELTCPAVVEVQSASFRANPQISILIFNGASDYGTA